MPDQEEKEKAFKVQDRRRFSAEGEARQEVPDREETSATPSGKPQQGAQGISSAGQQAEDAYARASTSTGEAGEAEEITFVGFVLSLSTEALALMGEMPHPATGERVRDLRGAQQFIDILGILREKTRGNLSAEEESLMEKVLFDLRMKYVEIARQAR